MNGGLKFGTIALLAAGSLWAIAEPAVEKFDGPESLYANKLAQVLKRWPEVSARAHGTVPVELTCVATAEQDNYVGMLQRTTIHADISVVERILDDVAHYKDLFPGIEDVHILPGSRIGNRYVTVWEQRVPVFFVPNLSFELDYLIDRSIPGRSVYRYKLRRSSELIASDGMVVLEASGHQATQFTEYDFFHARTGPLPTPLVWRESLRGAFLSDLAIKLKAENASWSYRRIASEAERLIAFESERIERCFDERRNGDQRVGF
jgi:hypothetical protein